MSSGEQTRCTSPVDTQIFVKGATGSAVIFSMVQTAIENRLDPYKYLIWLLKTAKDMDLSQECTIQFPLPWNAPAECRSMRKDSTI